MRRKPLFPPPHHPTTGKRLANKGRQSTSVLTINGRMEVLRRWWYAVTTGSVAPADEVLNGRGESVTPGVREMACRENQGATSFDKAAENLARTAQIQLSGEQLRLLVEAEGRKVQAVQQAAVLPTAWTAADCEVVVEGRGVLGKTRVYTGCDGVMVPVITQAEKQKRRTKILEKRRKGADQSWKEFKVVYFYNENLKHQHVAVTHLNHLAAGRLMRREADRLDFRRASERIANVDGAPWVREQLQYHLAELDGLGLDFYHLGENVHRARRVVFGESSAEGKTWVDELLHTFKHEGYEAAWERLVPWRSKRVRSPKKRKAADRLLKYVSQRQEMIRYPEFRNHDWQIGSGPTESQCKLTVGRLKGCSRRWDRPHAAAVAALDSLERSGQWHKYWATPCLTAAEHRQEVWAHPMNYLRLTTSQFGLTLENTMGQNLKYLVAIAAAASTPFIALARVQSRPDRLKQAKSPLRPIIKAIEHVGRKIVRKPRKTSAKSVFGPYSTHRFW